MNVPSVIYVLTLMGLVSCQAVPIDDQQEPIIRNTVLQTEKCAEVKGIDNTVACIALSTLSRLEDLSAKENIEILSGVVLESNIPKSERETRRKRTMELPTTADEKISKIFDMMFNVMSNLFSGRTLKIKMSENTTNSVMRAFDEGRGKMKKLTGPLMMALGAKMIAIVPIMIGGLALFASKALIVSKLALVLSLILGAQYLFSNGGNGLFNRFGQGGGWNNYNQGNYGGGHNYIPYGAPSWNSNWNTASQGYARAMQDNQDLAYSSHKQ